MHSFDSMFNTNLSCCSNVIELYTQQRDSASHARDRRRMFARAGDVEAESELHPHGARRNRFCRIPKRWPSLSLSFGPSTNPDDSISVITQKQHVQCSVDSFRYFLFWVSVFRFRIDKPLDVYCHALLFVLNFPPENVNDRLKSRSALTMISPQSNACAESSNV